MDSSLAFSLMKLLDCFFTPFVPVEVSLHFYDEVIFENLLKALLSHDLDFLWKRTFLNYVNNFLSSHL